MNTIYNIYNI